MLRPSVETLAAAMRKLGNAEDDDLGDESVRSIRPGLNNGGDVTTTGVKRNQRGSSRNRMLSPPPPGSIVSYEIKFYFSFIPPEQSKRSDWSEGGVLIFQ